MSRTTEQNREYMREWREKHREHLKEYQSRYKVIRKDELQDNRIRYILKHYYLDENGKVCKLEQKAEG